MGSRDMSCGHLQLIYAYKIKDIYVSIVTLQYLLSSCFHVCEGVASCFSLNLTLSHLTSYRTNDVDEAGWHTADVTISSGRSPGSYIASKIHRHKDYLRFSHENIDPGSRKDERIHVIKLSNNSHVSSAIRRVFGYLPENNNVNVKIKNNLGFRGEAHLVFEGVCEVPQSQGRRFARDVVALKKDSLPASLDHDFVHWSDVESLGNSDKSTHPTRVTDAMNCIRKDQPEHVIDKCVYGLIRLLEEDGFQSRQAVGLICEHENPLSFRWPYLVQSLGVTQTGQQCLAALLQNASLPASHQLAVIKGTHLVTRVEESLINSLLSFTQTTHRSNWTSRSAAVLALGLLIGVSNPTEDSTQRVLNHLHSSLNLCPTRELRAYASQFEDYVTVYTTAVGNAGHDSSFRVLMELMGHEWLAVRKASILSLRFLEWTRVEPVLREVLESNYSHLDEKLAAMNAILSRSGNSISIATLRTLERLLYASVDRHRSLEDAIFKVLKLHRSDSASQIVSEALNFKERRRRKANIVGRVRSERSLKDAVGAILRPLVDQEFGVNEKHRKTFGGSLVGATFNATFRNLARLYLSLFDAKVEFDIFNDVTVDLHLFGSDVRLAEGRATFAASLSYKNEFLSRLANKGSESVQRLFTNIHSTTAVLVKFVFNSLNYLEDVTSNVDRLLKPIEPILNLTRSGLAALDQAVQFGRDVQSFLNQVDGYVTRVTDVNFLLGSIEPLKNTLLEFVDEKLGELKDLANKTVTLITEPVQKVKGFLDTVVESKDKISTVLDKLEADVTNEFNFYVGQMADTLSNGYDEFSLSGGRVFSAIQTVFAQLSCVLDGVKPVPPAAGTSWWPSAADEKSSRQSKAGLLLNWMTGNDQKTPTGTLWWDMISTKGNVDGTPYPGGTDALFAKVRSLETWFTRFKSVGSEVLQKGMNDLPIPPALIDDMEKIAGDLESALTESGDTIEAFIAVAQSYSDLGRMVAKLNELASDPLLRTKMVSIQLSSAGDKVLNASKVCDVVNEVVDEATVYARTVVNNGLAAYDDLTFKAQEYLAQTKQKVFGDISLEGRYVNVMTIKNMTRDTLERAAKQLDKFLENNPVLNFNEIAAAFVANVDTFLSSKIEVVADWYDSKIPQVVEKWLSKSQEFVDLVKLARNITDFSIIIGEVVPSVRDAGKTISGMIDKVLDVADWADEVQTKLSSSKTMVGYADKAKGEVVGLIQHKLDKLESLLGMIIGNIKTHVNMATSSPLEFLDRGTLFVDSLKTGVLKVSDDVLGYVDFLNDLRTAAGSVNLTFNVTCNFQSKLKRAVAFGETFTAMWRNLSALTGVAADGYVASLVATAETVALPAVHLGRSFSSILEVLRNFTATHKNSMRTVLSLQCFKGTWCLKNLFLDDLRKVVNEAERVGDNFNALLEFESQLEKSRHQLEGVRSIANSTIDQITQLVKLSISDLDIVLLAKDVVGRLTMDANFGRDIGNSIQARTWIDRFTYKLTDKRNSTAIDFLVDQVPLVRSLRANVETSLQRSFASGAMNLLRKLSTANEDLFTFFDSLAHPGAVFRPLEEVALTIREVGNKMDNFVKQTFLIHLRHLSSTVASFTSIVADMKEVINSKVFGTIEWAIQQVKRFRSDVLPKVKNYLGSLLLLDRGLQAGELEDASKLSHCSAALCIRSVPRSTPRYRDWIFPLMYSHFKVLQRGSSVIPGLFEDYQVQGMCPLGSDGIYTVLTMFGTGTNEDLPSILVVIHKASGQIQRLYRLLLSDGGNLSLPLGVAATKTYLWLAGVEKVQETKGRGVLYGLLAGDLGDYSITALPVDLRVSVSYYTDSYGTAIAVYGSFLWIADFVDALKTSVGTPLPGHHKSSEKQYGWAAAYAVDTLGRLVAKTYIADSQTVLRPSRAVTIGQHVTGFVPFDQSWTPYFAVLRCIARAGYICRVEFFGQPSRTSELLNGVPIHYGIGLSLARGFPVPSGAISLSFQEKSNELLVSFNSGAQAEQARRITVGGDLEDRFFWFRPPVMENVLSLRRAVKANELYVTVLGRQVVAPRPLIPLSRKRRRSSDSSSCLSVTGELYKITRTFIKSCRFPCKYPSMSFGPFLGIGIRLDYHAYGTVTIGYEGSLCPSSLEAKAAVIPKAAIYAEASVSLSFFLVEAGAALKATILDTRLVPTVSLKLRGSSIKVCGDLKLFTRPLSIQLYAFVRVLGPKIKCKAWFPWCKIYIGVYFELKVTIFSWSSPELKSVLLPEVCYSTPDRTPPVGGEVDASQTDWQSLTAKWFGFKDEETEYLLYSVFAGTAPGIDNVMTSRNVGEGAVHTEGNLNFIHRRNVYVTVVCTNSAGLTAIATAAPFEADTTPPRVLGLLDGPGPQDLAYSKSKNLIQAHYSSIFDESTIELSLWAIGTSPSADDVQEYRDLNQAKLLSSSDLELQLGATYYVSVKVKNRLGLESVTATNGVLVDFTPPTVGDVYDNSLDCSKDDDYQIASIYYRACWLGFDDPESGITYYEWNVVRSDGRKAFQLQNVGTKLFSYQAGIALQLGRKYNVVVWAWNKAGLGTMAQSDGVVVDFTRPECSNVLDLVPGADGDQDYVTQLPPLIASWRCFDPESGLIEQKVSVGTYPGGADAYPFTGVAATNNVSTTFRFVSLPAIPGQPLYVTVKTLNKAGLQKTQWSDGITLDDTPPVAAAVYVRDGLGLRGTVDSDFQSSTQTLHVRWHDAFIDNESPIVAFYVGVNASNGSLIYDEINVGKVSDVTLTGLHLNSGDVYVTSVRCVNGAGLSTTVVTNGIMVDASPPKIGQLYDGTKQSRDIKYWSISSSAWANVPLCLWYHRASTWPPQANDNRPIHTTCTIDQWRDNESGLSYLETSVTSAQNVTVAPWKREGTDVEVIGRTVAGRHANMYIFRMRAYNRAGLYSEAKSDGFLIDVTAPVLTSLVEYDLATNSALNDIDYVVKDFIHLGSNWKVADSESGIYQSDWAIGSYLGGRDVLDHTAVLSLPVSHNMSNLDLGQTYYVLVRITNGAGLRMTASSDGFIVDYRPPSLGYVQDGWGKFDVEYQGVAHSAWMKWRWVDDFESGLDFLEVAVGYNSSDINYYLIETTSNKAVIRELQLISGFRYHAYVRATDKAGLSSVSHSNGVIVDVSPPQCYGVRDGYVGGLDDDFVTAISFLSANWDPCLDVDTGVMQYEFGISRNTSYGIELDHPYRVFGRQSKGTYRDINLSHGVKYYIFMKAINYAGVWSAVVSNGVTVDVTPPECSHVGDGLVGDKDYEVQSRYHAVNWQCAEDVSVITKAFLSVGSYRGGSDIRRSTINIALGRSVDNSTVLQEGITFFSTLTIWNSGGLKAVYTTDGISVDTSPPVSVFVHDGLSSTHDIDYQSSLNSLSVNWRFVDGESGIYCYFLRFLPLSQWSTRQEKVNSTRFTAFGTVIQGVSYQASVTAVDHAGLTVSVLSDGVMVDSIPADCSYVNDGFETGIDISFLSAWETAGANWNCSDPESGIVKLNWMIFRSLGDLVKIVILDKNVTHAKASDMSFKEGEKYYSLVSVTNAAGLTSNFTSNGFTIDSTPPVIVKLSAFYHPASKSFDITWSAYDNESGINNYFAAIGLSRDAYDILPVTAFGTSERINTSGVVSLQTQTTYYMTVIAVNRASAKSHSSVVGVADQTAPVFGRSVTATLIYPRRSFSATETFLDDAVIHITWSSVYDPESGVKAVKWAIRQAGQGDIANCSFKTFSSSPKGNMADVGGLRLFKNRAYEIVLSAENGVGLRNYMISTNFTVDFGSFVPGIVLDGPLYEDEDYQTHISGLWARWENFRDDTVGIQSYSWGLGTSPNVTDVLGLTNVELALSSHAIGTLNLQQGVTYYATVSATNKLGVNVTAASNGITIDRTRPICRSVTLGVLDSSHYYNTTQNLWVSWNCSDPESGIDHYLIALGKRPFADDLLTVFKVFEQHSYKLPSLNLTEDCSAYLTVTVFNKAGLSTVMEGNRVTFDFSAPSKGTVSTAWISRQIRATWSGFRDDSGVDHYEWAVGTTPGDDDVVPFTNAGLNTAIVADHRDLVGGTVCLTTLL